MKRRLVTTVLGAMIGLSLCACKGTAGDANVAPETTPEAATEAPTEAEPAETPTEAPEEGAAEGELVTTGGTPWIDSDLKENITADMEVSLKDDFHLAVNHDWLMKNEIAEGRSAVASFTEVSDVTDEKALALLNDDTLTGHDAELVQAYYHAILDWDARNAAGLTPIEGLAEEIKAIDSMEALSDFICDAEKSRFVPVLVSVSNTTSFEDSEHYITAINNESLLLGDPAE